MPETITFHIETVAPIHIGCDETYEPMGYVVDEAKQVLRAFDPLDFIRALNPADKTRFGAICANGTIESLQEIYKFMQGRTFPGHIVNLCSGFLGHYKKTLSLAPKDFKKELNQFTIARTAFNPHTGKPYIPGSSIKGALRTAWLNGVQRQRPVAKNDRRKGKELEKELLDDGDFASDPLRMLKVSDFMPVGNVRTRIVYAVNEKKKLSKFGAKGPYQILEVIEPGSRFEGTIVVNDPPSRELISHPIERQALLNSATRFYGEELRRENTELGQIGLSGMHPGTPASGFLLRVGRHSGAESVTIDGHRSIRVMQGKDKPAINLDHATTFWLAAEESKPADRGHLRPFGWVTVAPGPAPANEADLDADEDDAPSATAPTPSAPRIPAPVKTAAEKVLEELALIKTDDMGRIGTIIQRIETLPEATDKAAVAAAIRDKLGKGYKKHKRKDYLEALINAVDEG